jgi:hypothetical protein
VHATAPPPPPPLDDIDEIAPPVPSTALHSTPPDAPTEEAEEDAEPEAKAEGQEEAALIKAIQEALLSQGTDDEATVGHHNKGPIIGCPLGLQKLCHCRLEMGGLMFLPGMCCRRLLLCVSRSGPLLRPHKRLTLTRQQRHRTCCLSY